MNNKVVALLVKSRKERGLSMVQVAAELGVTPQYVWLFEKGRASVSGNMLGRLCEIYKIPLTPIVDMLTEEYRSALSKTMREGKAEFKDLL